MAEPSTISGPPPEKETDFVSRWVEDIEAAGAEEKDWRVDADKAVCAYSGKAEGGSKDFNIFHSNIETLTPALYSSTPVPDVRRRYSDDDPTGKAVANLLERALSYSVDAYDFDGVMQAAVRDMTIVDRGVVRVRYLPQFTADGKLGYEETTCEYVPWRAFRRGSGRVWSDVSWIAFQHFMGKDQLREKVHPAVLEQIPFTHSASAKDAKDNRGKTPSERAKRAQVWEVWDKDSREVNFICPDMADHRLYGVADPLGLNDFFPIPRPMQAIAPTDTLVPITPYSIYEGLVAELNTIQARIMRLVKQLRPRGGYAGTSLDVKSIADAGDGELVALSGTEMFTASGGGIEKAITWFPLDATVAALAQLVAQREQIKQTIYEVTGIADILRGASNAAETATAQQIKAQWGSLRVQHMQAEVARFARDLFRLKAEVIAKRFQMSTLRLMTGLEYPPMQIKQALQQRQAQIQQQAQQQPPQGPPPMPAQPPAPPLSPQEQAALAQPSVEEVETMMREDAGRGFRIDIESDSTIRGDLTRNQQQMSLFLQGTAQFVGSVGPLVEKGVMPGEIAVEILSAFTRHFKLGKQAEDALDRWTDKARQQAQAPPAEKPDPAAIKTEAEKKAGEIKIAGMAAKAQIDERAAQRDETLAQAQHDRDMAKLTADVQADAAKTQNELLRGQIAPPGIFGGLPQ